MISCNAALVPAVDVKFEALDQKVDASLAKLFEARRKRDMYLGFAEDPVAFLNIIIASQVSTVVSAAAAQLFQWVMLPAWFGRSVCLLYAIVFGCLDVCSIAFHQLVQEDTQGNLGTYGI